MLTWRNSSVGSEHRPHLSSGYLTPLLKTCCLQSLWVSKGCAGMWLGPYKGEIERCTQEEHPGKPGGRLPPSKDVPRARERSTTGPVLVPSGGKWPCQHPDPGYISRSRRHFWCLSYPGFPGGSGVKNPPANVGDAGESVSIQLGKISWRRDWQSAPIFLPGKFHGQRSMMGYSPWGWKESDMVEQLSTYAVYRTLLWWF